MPDSSSTVPPFIPGLLIVSLLIIISIIIGWRNYVRRGNPRLMPGMGNWEVWEEAERSGCRTRMERPKMWEVGVGEGAKSEAEDESWEKIMPLSATSLAPEQEHSPLGSPSDLEISRNQTSVIPSRLPRLSFLSPSSLPPSSSLPAPRLQVSVLISMPSPQRTQRRISAAHSPVEVRPEEAAPRPSISSSVRKEKMPMDAAEEEGSPEVALGVAVLPWTGEDGDPEVGHMTK